MALGSADRRGRDERIALTAAAAVSVALAFFVIRPYLQYVLLGVVVAYVLQPIQHRLETRLGRSVAALTLVAATFLAAFVPLALVVARAIQEGLVVVRAVQNGDVGVPEVEAGLASYGFEVDLMATWVTYQDPIREAARNAVDWTLGIATALPDALIGLTVTAFVLFALLRDGDRAVDWATSVVPLAPSVTREFVDELDDLMWGSIVGNAVVALVQGVVLGVALALVGFSGLVFWTVVTFLAGLLPLVGAFAVWFPAGVYLLLVGDAASAVAVVVVGVLVSLMDDYLRPILIGRESHLDAATVVVGIFGGVVVFGVVGLFVGPVVLGGAKAAVDLWARERDRDRERDRERDVTADPPDPPLQ